MIRSSRTEIRRRTRTRHPRRDLSGQVRLSIVLPSYKEERIGDSVERVRSELAHLGGGLEVVVVDDGSGDETAVTAKAAGADHVVELAVNQGKGGAVRAGMAVTRGRTVAFTDADLSYAPAQIERMLLEVEDGWDVVIGNRHHSETETVAGPSLLRAAGGRVINAATKAVLVGGYQDTQGGLKAFRGDVARTLFDHLVVRGFAFDVEVLFLAERAGLSVREVPVTVENSERSTVHVARDAARLLRDLATIRRTAAAGGYDAAVTAIRAAAEPVDGLGPSPDR